ncbi:MAG: hypothetical protein IJA98_08800 [Bacteroidaceae bacterium]|nr:hypothetical protein [Bacteroidaceae bacterium]
MRKRLENLSPLGNLVATEVAKCGFTVETFCSVAHISKTTYYKLLFGKTL